MRRRLLILAMMIWISSCAVNKPPQDSLCYGLEKFTMQEGSLDIAYIIEPTENIVYFWKDDKWWRATGRDVLTRPTKEWLVKYNWLYERECE